MGSQLKRLGGPAPSPIPIGLLVVSGECPLLPQRRLPPPPAQTVLRAPAWPPEPLCAVLASVPHHHAGTHGFSLSGPRGWIEVWQLGTSLTRSVWHLTCLLLPKCVERTAPHTRCPARGHPADHFSCLHLSRHKARLFDLGRRILSLPAWVPPAPFDFRGKPLSDPPPCPHSGHLCSL